MGTNAHEIRAWLTNAKRDGATHVVIVCDTFDHSNFPVPVMPSEKVRDVFEAHDNKDMNRVMEVYALHLDIEAQLSEHRAFHFEYPPAAAGGEGCEPEGSVGPSTLGEPSSFSPASRSDEAQHEGAAGRDRPNYGGDEYAALVDADDHRRTAEEVARAGGVNVPSEMFLFVLECGGAPAIDCSCGRTVVANNPEFPGLATLKGAHRISDDSVAGIELGGRMFVVGCPCGELAWLERLIWSFQVPIVKYIRARRAAEIADIEGLHDDE